MIDHSTASRVKFFIVRAIKLVTRYCLVLNNLWHQCFERYKLFALKDQSSTRIVACISHTGDAGYTIASVEKDFLDGHGDGCQVQLATPPSRGLLCVT